MMPNLDLSPDESEEKKVWQYARMMIVLVAANAAVACAQAISVEAPVSSQTLLVACEEPRPQLCTMQYDPVCGLTASNQYKTYSNACSACSDASVSGHNPGACE
jgi:hypothetical protein